RIHRILMFCFRFFNYISVLPIALWAPLSNKLGYFQAFGAFSFLYLYHFNSLKWKVFLLVQYDRLEIRSLYRIQVLRKSPYVPPELLFALGSILESLIS